MSLEAKEDKSKCKCATKDSNGNGNGKVAPLDLLEENWFFNNTLKGRRELLQRPPLMPKSPTPHKHMELGIKNLIQEDGKVISTPKRFPGGRRLLRTPSLPPLPRVSVEAKEEPEEEKEQEQDVNVGQEQEEEDLNWSSIYEGVLRTKQSEGVLSAGSLLRAPSMPVPPAVLEEDGREDEAAAYTKSSFSKLTYSYSSLDGNYCSPSQASKVQTPEASADRHRRGGIRSYSTSNHHHLLNGGNNYYRNALQKEKKWKSSSDLESIEVQGFKDLGFVFDKEELKESLANVIPGLRDKKCSGGDGGDDGNVSRPYLSEAWCVRRLVPPAIMLADKKSAAEMKDQIRLWAQAVACNVRQER